MTGKLSLARNNDLTTERAQRPQLRRQRRELAHSIVELDLGAFCMGFAYVLSKRLQLQKWLPTSGSEVRVIPEWCGGGQGI